MTDLTLTGSCLCGAVHYTASGTLKRFYQCHCQRCRKATGSAHASNLFMQGSLNWDQGKELIRTFKLPEAKRFGNIFCTKCGSRLPAAVPAMNFIMIPAGSLNDEPGLKPSAKVFWGSKAAWSCNDVEIPVFEEYPD